MPSLAEIIAKNKPAPIANWSDDRFTGPYSVYPEGHALAGQQIPGTAPKDYQPGASTAPGATLATAEQIKAALRPMLDEIFVLQERMKDAEAKLAERERVIILDKETGTRHTFDGVAHKQLERVVARVQAGVNVMLVGPTQCGKTTLAGQVAKVLGRPYAANSMSAGVTESAFFGWLLPTGANGSFEYQPAPFVNMFLQGGIQLLDEMDAADNNLLLSLNMAIANREMFIPQRLEGQYLKAHPNFAAIAATNTWGTGSDMGFVGRNELDAATLARFVRVEVDYDMELEYRLSHEAACATGHAIRANLRDQKLQRVLTTRTMMDWTKLMAVGISLEECLSDYFLGWEREERDIALRKSPAAREAQQESAEARARAILAARDEA